MGNNYNIKSDGGLLPGKEPLDIITRYERIPTTVFESLNSGTSYIADAICKVIRNNDTLSKQTILGLSSGSSTQGVYKELIRRYNHCEISFSNVIVFALDEFYPLIKRSVRGESRDLYMQLFNHIDILPENIYAFRQEIEASQTTQYCIDFEKQIDDLGGFDLMFFGIGTKGEIGYNDPGTSVNSRTRIIAISQSRQKHLSTLFSNINNTPKSAFTMGISTIMKSKRVIVGAWSEEKSIAIEKMVEQDISKETPASFLQLHNRCEVVITEDAASELTRFKTPWKVGTCNWTDRFTRKAVVWLCGVTKKPILKLTLPDYTENDLSQMVEYYNDYASINIKIFNDLQHTITGWPGGKPNTDDSTRPERAFPFPKRVLIFSPHPDDDVISMGGTAIRLFDQGHELHIAYQTSGNIAVSDDVVLQTLDTARECGLGDKYQQIEKIIQSKDKEDIEPEELRKIKGAIRRAEAMAACRSFGMDRKNIRFLNLPFYETGAVQKGGLTSKDIEIISNLINEIKPHQIYAAGDLSDPHGTHRTCIDGIIKALEQSKNESWMRDCRLWLYRGAWQEWDLDMVDMAVPLSPSEVVKKRHAIFRHASQKDIVPFPGEDSREFWQRAEQRTKSTAEHYDSLGMAEYEAIEVFVEYKIYK